MVEEPGSLSARRAAVGRRYWLVVLVGLPFLVLISAASIYRDLSVVSAAAGFVVGLLLTAPLRRWWVLLSLYLPLLVVSGILFGRTPSSAIAVAVSVVVGVVLFAVLGRSLRLVRLRVPSDVARLALVAAAAAVVMPAFAWVTTAVARVGSPSADLLLQSCLTISVGIIVGTPLAVEMTRSDLRGPVLRNLLEVGVLAAATVALLSGTSLLEWGALGGLGSLLGLVVALGWVALRFGPTLAAPFLAGSALWIGITVAAGHGVFVAHSETELAAVLNAQVFLAVTAVGILLLAVYAQHTREQDARALEAAQILLNSLEGADADLFLKRYDADTDRFVYSDVNTSFARSLGLDRADVVGRSDEELLDPQQAASMRAQDESVVAHGSDLQFVFQTHRRGRTVHWYSSKFPVRDPSGAIVGVGGIRIDRTEERRREELLQLVFSRSPVPTARLRWSSGRIGEVLEVNDAFALLLGAQRDELVGRALDQVLFPDSPFADADGSGLSLSTQRREMRLRRLDGTELTVLATTTVVSPTDASGAFALVILEDVTEARAAQAGLMHRATHDPLTDLFNRQAFLDRMTSAIGGLRGGDEVLAVMCCDLDGFKQYNDSLGHDSGDRILLEVADRMRRAVRPGDVVGRLGADEFVVLCPHMPGEDDAVMVARRISEVVGQSLEVDGRQHTLGVSVGVVVGSRPESAEDLLRKADIALTRAKDSGRGRVEVYRPDLDRRVQIRLAMRETVRLALSGNRVEVHAQPVVDVRTGATVGAEALVRLRDLDGSLLAPAAFIPVAEQSGQIVPLGLRVLDLALAMQAQWSAAGFPIDIAVNVSPRQLAEQSFPGAVETLLAAHEVPPGSLTLEVTETAIIDASGPTVSILRRIRDTGVHVAIDDFGTGYSSLSSLRELPADLVKVDRSFVAGMATDPGDEAIVRAVLAMAHATGRLVVAEGVENPWQAERLAELGCDRLQGYLFSVPVPPVDFDPGRRFAPAGEATARQRQRSLRPGT